MEDGTVVTETETRRVSGCRCRGPRKAGKNSTSVLSSLFGTLRQNADDKGVHQDDRYKADAPSSSGGTSLTFPRTAPTRPTAPTAKPPPASPYPYEDIFPPSVAEPPPTHSHPSSPHLRRPAAATAAERDSVLDHYYDLETYRDRSVSPTTLASFPSPPPVAARFA